MLDTSRYTPQDRSGILALMDANAHALYKPRNTRKVLAKAARAWVDCWAHTELCVSSQSWAHVYILKSFRIYMITLSQAWRLWDMDRSCWIWFRRIQNCHSCAAETALGTVSILALGKCKIPNWICIVTTVVKLCKAGGKKTRTLQKHHRVPAHCNCFRTSTLAAEKRLLDGCENSQVSARAQWMKTRRWDDWILVPSGKLT